MDLINVWVDDDRDIERGEKLAQRVRAPVVFHRPKSELVLFLNKGKVGLGFGDDRPLRPYYVDFLSLDWRFRRHRGLRDNKLFLTATSSKPGVKISDVTAGFGQDAFMMAWAGADVTACERSPVVHALLEDGLRRAFADEDWEELAPRMNLELCDSTKRLKNSPQEFDVVYIDPMFNKPKKSAKSPKAMQLLQTLFRDESQDIDGLVDAALKSARQRVVIKLPLKGDSLAGRPDITFAGQSIRYDVYLLK